MSGHVSGHVSGRVGGRVATPRVVCAVGGHADELFALRSPSRPGQSVPASVRSDAGGCALNVAAGLAASGAGVTHAGLRGSDAAGAMVADALRRHGVGDAALVLPDAATGRYAALVEPDGTLALAAAAMGIYARAGELADHAPFTLACEGADALLLDANGPPGAAEMLADRRGGAALALLATSARKAPVLASLMARAEVVFANAGEWAALGDGATESGVTGSGATGSGVTGRIALAFVTDGARGASALRYGEEIARAAPPAGPLRDVVGGGDAFAAGALHAVLTGADPAEALRRGLACAARCVAHEGALGWLADGPSTGGA